MPDLMLEQRLQSFNLFNHPHDKPRVVVSACLLGHAVRYDGEHKAIDALLEKLAPWVTLDPLCPEVGIGMPVPRPPVQVVDVNGQRQVRGVDFPGMVITDELAAFARHHATGADGLLLKARSPSCGIGTTPLYLDNGLDSGLRVDGQFALEARRLVPGIPVADESVLDSEELFHAFVVCTHLSHTLHAAMTTQDRADHPASLARDYRELCADNSDPVLQRIDRWLSEWLAPSSGKLV